MCGVKDNPLFVFAKILSPPLAGGFRFTLFREPESGAGGGVRIREKGQTEHVFSSALGAGIGGAHCFYSVLFRLSFTDIICLSADRWLFLMGIEKMLMLKPSLWPCRVP